MRAILDAGSVPVAVKETDWIVAAARAGTGSPAEQRTSALEMARRRASGEPLQYILGSQPFRHVELEVGPGVFIPRPETETVAAVAMRRLPQGGALVDLCTGSGAIALAVLHERPDARVLGTEISSEALGFARRNATVVAPGSDPDAMFLQGDLFEPLPESLRGSLDVVVANPPYIAPHEATTLPRDVVAHEPHQALFTDRDGLEVIERIAREAGSWLAGGGALVSEIGSTQGDAVARLLAEHGYEDVRVETDLAGRDRVVSAHTAAPWSRAAGALQRGEVIAVPTDTVYGLAARLEDASAIDAIFDLKGRSRDLALPVLVANVESAGELARLDDRALVLARSLWPGPLTMVLPRRPSLTADLGGVDPGTVAVRIPGDAELLRLLAAVGPLAVTSANISGAAPATSERQAKDVFPALEVVPTKRPPGGMASTIVSLSGEARVLREGPVSGKEIEAILQKLTS